MSITSRRTTPARVLIIAFQNLACLIYQINCLLSRQFQFISLSALINPCFYLNTSIAKGIVKCPRTRTRRNVQNNEEIWSRESE